SILIENGPVKPAPFDYSRPTSLDEALGLLAELDADGKVLAGGQSLVPLLSMRLAAPHHLVDINRLDELAYVRCAADGVRVGAIARHADVEGDEEAARVQPLLRKALQLVAHPTIRNRGTTVGSLVHADPAAEMPAVLALLGGSVRVASAGGSRDVAAADFFAGPLESALSPGELAVEAMFPAQPPRTGSAVEEVARRHGDYAVCGVCAVVSLDEDLHIVSARAAYVSVAPTPLVLDLSAALAGRAYDADVEDVRDAVAVDPEADIHASAAYRRHLAGVLTARAVRAAAREAAA
ncbi:MAG TPA: xanthine dehydrogenase family protein subunit M, partial [Jatrophihabitantaceae bacterium]|nr:xanthine dehydrogenase family protein subunit M [Jatrophihabitantaceae bacterium]